MGVISEAIEDDDAPDDARDSQTQSDPFLQDYVSDKWQLDVPEMGKLANLAVAVTRLL